MKKQSYKESEKRKEERRSEKRKSQREERRCRRAKKRKVAQNGVFQMFWGSGGSKSRLVKAAGAEPCGQVRDEQLHAVVA